MTGVSSLSLNILVPAIPSLVAKFAADPASVQLTLSLYLLGLAVAQLVFGPLSDRFGRRPVVLAGLALAAVASTAAIFAASIASLIVAARRAVARRLDRANDRPRDHPRSLRARTRRLDDRAGHLGRGAHADGGAADRRRARHLVRLGGDLRVHRRAERHGIRLGGAGVARDAHAFSAAPGGRGRFRADLRALAASPRFFGYALCAGFGSAPFFSFLGGAPHVVVTMLGHTSAEYGLWFFVPSIGFMAGNFAVSRLTGASASTP